MADERGATAQRIRDLAGEGMSIAQIAEIVGKRYQHVYNTLRYSKGMKDEEEARKAERAKFETREQKIERGRQTRAREEAKKKEREIAPPEEGFEISSRYEEEEEDEMLGQDLQPEGEPTEEELLAIEMESEEALPPPPSKPNRRKRDR